MIPKYANAKDKGMIVEDPKLKLSTLEIEDKEGIKLVKRLPFSTLYEKFGITENKNYEEIAFTVCANCILSPMFGHPRFISEDDKQRLITHLKDFLHVDNAPQIIHRIQEFNKYGKEVRIST
jgi:hypothetical protein